MNGLDLLIALSALSAVVAGYRVGLLARVLSWVGLLLGLLIAAQNMPYILRMLGDPPPGKAAVEVAFVLFAAATVGKFVGMGVGRWLHHHLPLRPLRKIDRLSGAGLGLAGVAVVTWLVVPLMAEVPGWPAEQSRRSAIGRVVNDVAPQPPAALGALRGWMAAGAFPRVLDALRPSPDSGEAPEQSALDRGVEDRVRASVVLVEGQACRYIESGTGFAIGPGRVVTNAHVVAGATGITVTTDGGVRHRATLRAFDPDRDLALLRVDDLDVEPLRRRTADTPGAGGADVEDGAAVAVFGHPGGGALRVAPAVVRTSVRANGRDIYDRARSRREVLVLSARLQGGDSGSPVVDADGRVVGVAFAVAPDQPGTAYALSAAELGAFLSAPPITDSTGPCLVD